MQTNRMNRPPSSISILALAIISLIFLAINATAMKRNIVGAERNTLPRRHPFPDRNVQKRTTTEEANRSGGIADEGAKAGLFREYLSRGMFSCATKYVGILQKLNKFIVTAHQEYSECKGQMQRAQQSVEESRKLADQLEMINELFSDE